MCAMFQRMLRTRLQCRLLALTRHLPLNTVPSSARRICISLLGALHGLSKHDLAVFATFQRMLRTRLQYWLRAFPRPPAAHNRQIQHLALNFARAT